MKTSIKVGTLWGQMRRPSATDELRGLGKSPSPPGTHFGHLLWGQRHPTPAEFWGGARGKTSSGSSRATAPSGARPRAGRGRARAGRVSGGRKGWPGWTPAASPRICRAYGVRLGPLVVGSMEGVQWADGRLLRAGGCGAGQGQAPKAGGGKGARGNHRRPAPSSVPGPASNGDPRAGKVAEAGTVGGEQGLGGASGTPTCSPPGTRVCSLDRHTPSLLQRLEGSGS